MRCESNCCHIINTVDRWKLHLSTVFSIWQHWCSLKLSILDRDTIFKVWKMLYIIHSNFNVLQQHTRHKRTYYNDDHQFIMSCQLFLRIQVTSALVKLCSNLTGFGSNWKTAEVTCQLFSFCDSSSNSQWWTWGCPLRKPDFSRHLPQYSSASRKNIVAQVNVALTVISRIILSFPEKHCDSGTRCFELHLPHYPQLTGKRRGSGTAICQTP